MKQIVQDVSNGQLKVVEVPQPEPGATEVLVATRRSLLSSGTEKAVRELASSNLMMKARARPDLVRQVVARAHRDGLRSTVDAVRTRLNDEMPLGYSAAGVVVSVGEYVADLRPGMRVATASAGHAEYQLVPALLAVPIPDEVSDEDAAFGAVAAIALQGLRQAEVGVGGSICVIGLGLVGQLTVRLARAAGLNVAGIDLRSWTAELAARSGALGMVEGGDTSTQQIRSWARERGVDAVLLTAATPSSEPVARAARLLRDRGRIVVVGDVGLNLDRRPFYQGELDIRFARSYGPGRYDRSYEEWAVDYPVGHVRWTEGRNIEAYVDLLKTGSLRTADLVTHVFDVTSADEAYATMHDDSARSLAIQLSYSAPPITTNRAIAASARKTQAEPRAGIIGAGNYARATFLPVLKKSDWNSSLVAVTSSSGRTARHLAQTYGIPDVVASGDLLLADSSINTVFILSRHDSHADLTIKALNSGKNVYVEKPMAISQPQLEAIRASYRDCDSHLFVGFNRRYSAAAVEVAAFLSGTSGPLTITYRVNAGRLPDSHWYNDRKQGGRVLGEVCHFIDLANWLVGRRPSDVHAMGSPRGELLLTESVSVLLGWQDGSQATIAYCVDGFVGTSKERLEVLSGGHTLVIDDFRALSIDGRSVRLKGPDKGHLRSVQRFRAILQNTEPLGEDTLKAFDSTQAALDVVAALGRHEERLAP